MDGNAVSERPRPTRRLWVWGPTLLVILLLGGIGNDRTGTEPASGSSFESATSRPDESAKDGIWRVASFNIHSGVGTDGQENLGRIASVLQQAEPQAEQPGGASGHPWDFAGLNEVRAAHWLFGGTPQVMALASMTRADWLFSPAERQWWHDHYGNAALSRRPVTYWQRIPLPCTKGKGYRNLLWVELADAAATSTNRVPKLLIAHIDRGADRERQLEIAFRLFRAMTPPVVLMGDLNTPRHDAKLSALLAEEGVMDLVGRVIDNDPAERIDWILGRGVSPRSGGLVENEASDHPLVWSEFQVDQNIQ